MNAYTQDLDKTLANFQPLTPLTFLHRAAHTFPDHPAVIHGQQRTTHARFFERSCRLASALTPNGVGKGDTVSVMLANTPPMLEAHHGVPMTGAVLHSINPRLDAAAVAFQLEHANAKVLIADREFAETIRAALARASVKPLVVDYHDPEFPRASDPVSPVDFESFMAGGSAPFEWHPPDDRTDRHVDPPERRRGEADACRPAHCFFIEAPRISNTARVRFGQKPARFCPRTNPCRKQRHNGRQRRPLGWRRFTDSRWSGSTASRACTGLQASTTTS